MIQNNPNATAAGLTGTVATIIVGTAALFDVEIDGVYAAALATLLVTVVLAIGRRGPFKASTSSEA